MSGSITVLAQCQATRVSSHTRHFDTLINNLSRWLQFCVALFLASVFTIPTVQNNILRIVIVSPFVTYLEVMPRNCKIHRTPVHFWNEKVMNCKVGGWTITLINTAAENYIDFNLTILQAHRLLHPLQLFTPPTRQLSPLPIERTFPICNYYQFTGL